MGEVRDLTIVGPLSRSRPTNHTHLVPRLPDGFVLDRLALALDPAQVVLPFFMLSGGPATSACPPRPIARLVVEGLVRR